jgi:TatD DNase family protein
MERLLIETDSPYLAPQPVRGKRCEPVYLGHVADTLAGVKRVSLTEIARVTSENACRAFNVKGRPQ